MNKTNAMAAIIKFINGRNDSPDSMVDVVNYTTDNAKTKNGTLVATQGCSSEHPVDDMLANKRLHNKTNGKQYEHFVLAPCPNGSDKSPESVLKAAKEIVSTLFPEHMAVITVHIDTKVIHAHTVLDCVNAVTGRKFSQSPADLNRVKQKTNNILVKHGFEMITASANDFVDHTDYSSEEGFAFLELDESLFITESIVEEISSFTGSLSLANTPNLFCGWDYPSCNNNNFGGYQMNNNYTPYGSQTQNMPVTTPTVEVVPSTIPMAQQTQDLPAHTASVDTVPATIETPRNSLPNTNVVTGPTFRIKGMQYSNFAGLNELVEQTMTDAQNHQREAANLALAMQQYGQQTGFPSNVAVYAGPIFDIDMTGGLYPPIPGYDNNKY